MDRDGTRDGFDLELTRQVVDTVGIPVVASGGVGRLEHLVEGAVAGGADAVLAASIFHFGEATVAEAKARLAAAGVLGAASTAGPIAISDVSVIPMARRAQAGDPDADRPGAGADPPAEGERKSRAGILIPATAQVARRLAWAEVVAAGPARAVHQAGGPGALQPRGPLRGRGPGRGLPDPPRARHPRGGVRARRRTAPACTSEAGLRNLSGNVQLQQRWRSVWSSQHRTVFTVHFELEPDRYTVCRPAGELDAFSVHQFRQALAEVASSRHLVIDLSAVPFVDSAGLGALIGGIRRVRELGGIVVVACGRSTLASLLHTTGIDRIVTVTVTVAEAAAWLEQSGSGAATELTPAPLAVET